MRLVPGWQLGGVPTAATSPLEKRSTPGSNAGWAALSPPARPGKRRALPFPCSSDTGLSHPRSVLGRAGLVLIGAEVAGRGNGARPALHQAASIHGVRFLQGLRECNGLLFIPHKKCTCTGRAASGPLQTHTGTCRLLPAQPGQGSQSAKEFQDLRDFS